MDHAPLAFDSDGVDAERLRMSSFRLGKPVSPADSTMASKPIRHSRSHSRNSSVSTPMPFVPPAPSHSPLPSLSSDSPPQSPTRNSLGGTKRNSHHRRRSSVSTRRESADMMGVSLPTLPQSSSEDNINLGDKDSVRRRALWALEGKPAVGNFSVEIPELDASEVPKRSFDFPSKPSFPPGVGAGFGGGLNNLMGNKRDSKFMASSSSSELLGTLVEEEEEDEDEEGAQEITLSPAQESPAASQVQVALTVTSPSPAPARHRPASLNLRPLSLALSNSVQASNGDLPTPSPTPSPRPGLKSLTLPSSQTLSGLSSNTASNKRHSLIMSSPDPTSNSFGRRPSLNLSMDTAVAPQPNRRSSISYVSSGDSQPVSMYGLPTPEMTPTSSTIERRRSTSTSSTSSFDMDHLRGRPLSTSEQHFLFQAHQTLVQRITDLERALKRSSSRSRPVSCASDVSSSTAPSEPSDEMLQLIADLKSERDELKKDVDGWRGRVADLERQIDVHAKRLDVERRDAWVARQRYGLLEVEKSTLDKTLAEKTSLADELQAKYDVAQQDLQKSQAEIARLTAEVERMRGVEDECARLRAEVLQERKKRTEMERELEHAGLLDTPRPFGAAVHSIPSAVSRTMMYAKSRGLGFRSIDSESSFTDVESVDDNRGPELKAVEEVDEDDDRESMYDDDDDNDNELARYEDEDENDEYAFPTSSSYGSVADYSRSTTPRLSGDSADTAPALVISRSPSASPSPLPSPAEPIPVHARHKSLSKAWSFPTAAAGVAVVPRPREEMDHFFACLEDVDNSPPLDSKLRSVESGKNLFSQALAEYEDELPPFVIPSDVGEVIVSPEMEASPQRTLDVVLEEEEEEEEEEVQDDDSHDNDDEEFVGEEDEGGIKFTFGPPPSDYCVDAGTSTPDLTMSDTSTPESVNKTGLFFEPADEDEADSSFTFPQMKAQRTNPSPSAIPRLRSPSPSKLPLPAAATSTPVKAASPLPLPRLCTSPSSFSTPPPKRASTTPTFIPQPRASVPQTSSPPSLGKVASFIPQPKRASTSPRPSAIPVMSPPTSTADVSRSAGPVTSRPPAPAPAMKTPTLPSRPVFEPAPDSPKSAASHVSPTPTPSSPSLMSPTLARLSFQALTNFIPVPSLLWSPRSSGGCFDASPSDSSISSSGSSSHVRSDSTFVNASATAVAKPDATAARERAYVAKEKQLEKLRLRLEEERRRGGQAAVTGLGFEVKKTQPGVLNI
ncbi:hypothetical protein C8Q77DRAFT_1153414 [Trametes polyzona]|nr:hypothetical protein C8Q77DRAFT_1153414 [Trametes polyzona]